jgi:hypothetical protein
MFTSLKIKAITLLVNHPTLIWLEGQGCLDLNTIWNNTWASLAH